MAEHLSILEFLQKMIDNVGLRDWFAQDPGAAMAHYGLHDVSPADVRDAITLAEDNQTADFSRHYNTGLHATLPALAPTGAAPHTEHHTAAATHSEHHNNSSNSSNSSSAGSAGSAGHSAGHHEAVEHLSRYLTNNYIDDRDTTIDNSLNQQLRTDGGNVTQDIKTHTTLASGDGAVAAGDDITDSAVTTGHSNQVGDDNVAGRHNVVGDDNQVASGHDNTTAFGDGAATSAHIDGAKVSGGGALSIGGAADGRQVTADSHDHTTTDTTDTSTVNDTGNVHADTEANSHNTTHNETSTDSHNQVHLDELSHNHVEIPVDVPPYDGPVDVPPYDGPTLQPS